mmetsp:Transcript_3348/g.3750  ORF Transcript_3348/g.3750 Transcript_3348/m.3750 type:complete len:319 (+) Transcript_3348:134-1090(+)|eukprot:CAMPEP_0198255824 /NCGR_PEP_ID=MMETSP1447-20131203/5876_1 /TAXON_ID=420782 /ORGANISM="Chaetoceros dichaeta, Strain CCMP1751" /LENGTH=318 /DNA_ID=CAMNT_0043942305 /DNA_START=52 /DNA_END=1008 /DNA_ORIENTATION=-
MSDSGVPARCPPESLFPPLPPDDGTDRLYVGSTAGLQNLRQYAPSSNTDCGTASVVVEEGSNCEQNLHYLHSALVTFSFPTESTASPPHSFQSVEGQVFVTSRRVLFVTMEKSNNDFDLAIDSARISLHAMTSEPKCSVYCQLASSSSPENAISFLPQAAEHDGGQVSNGGPGEIHFSPPDDMAKDKKQEFCQGLFDSLSQLASLNPASDDGDGGGGMAAMMNMMAATYGDDRSNSEGVEDDEDEMICRIDPRLMDNAWGNTAEGNTLERNSGGATIEERNAMLDRLDNVLTIPSNYYDNEGAIGQFDDADEDGDDLL